LYTADVDDVRHPAVLERHAYFVPEWFHILLGDVPVQQVLAHLLLSKVKDTVKDHTAVYYAVPQVWAFAPYACCVPHADKQDGVCDPGTFRYE
jgi:hypothetical protein